MWGIVKLSLPFEGGVAGSADYLNFAKLYFPAGVVDFIRSFVPLYP
jgi:hypothetical protein